MSLAARILEPHQVDRSQFPFLASLLLAKHPDQPLPKTVFGAHIYRDDALLDRLITGAAPPRLDCYYFAYYSPGEGEEWHLAAKSGHEAPSLGCQLESLSPKPDFIVWVAKNDDGTLCVTVYEIDN